MDIKTKLNVGDTLFVISEIMSTKKEECKACRGKGKIILEDKKEYECPSCNGQGHHLKNKIKEWQVLGGYFEGTPVGKIGVEISGRKKQSIKIHYFPKGMGNYFYEENCFASLKEAQGECNQRNMIIKKENIKE